MFGQKNKKEQKRTTKLVIKAVLSMSNILVDCRIKQAVDISFANLALVNLHFDIGVIKNCNFNSCTFYEVSLDSVEFQNCTFVNTRFIYTDFCGVYLYDCTLENIQTIDNAGLLLDQVKLTTEGSTITEVLINSETCLAKCEGSIVKV